ncbi:hypothetical protein [Mycobacterium sp.]|uniref:hypothetical protein n=1 Tax=Mycobacterium sp. TaxID=1785 RepID=UPI002B578752|nr:hypothetical protein [Mycobacterium sp.]HME48750.1 hypothetical protein [Mycobacterium sp.]
MTKARLSEADRRRRGLALIVWIAVIALFVVLLWVTVMVAAQLSSWAFTGRARVTTASAHHRAVAISVDKDRKCTVGPHG